MMGRVAGAIMRMMEGHELVQIGGAPIEKGARNFRVPVDHRHAVVVRLELECATDAGTYHRRAPKLEEIRRGLARLLEEAEAARGPVPAPSTNDRGWLLDWEMSREEDAE